jgi:hypothetical protein
MINNNIIDLREKILKGIALAFDKLIQTKQKNNDELVYSKNGKIVFIKANELNK